MKWLLCLMLAGCHGSCSTDQAASAAAGPGAICVAHGDTGLCIKGDLLYGCNLVGNFTYDAKCDVIGTISFANQNH